MKLLLTVVVLLSVAAATVFAVMPIPIGGSNMKNFVILSILLLMCLVALAGPTAPASGEQIKLQVIGTGGSASSSTNYKLGGTVGQTAAGPTTSTNYKLNQGYWQGFAVSCCVGTRGNLNCFGIIDLSDLSMLICFLTCPSKPTLCCAAAANVNGTGIIDLSDLSLLIAYLTNPVKPTLPPC